MLYQVIILNQGVTGQCSFMLPYRLSCQIADSGVEKGKRRLNLGQKMKLTIQGIDFSPIKDSPYKILDGNGLYLFISTAGTKTWYLKYRRVKKQGSMPIGRYPEVGLSAARAAADEARQLLAAGRDPAIERKRKRRR